MNQLPSEILGEIFIHLHQHDQMECMLVCHHWRQVIEEFVLYNTVYIYSKASLEKFTKQIQQHSEIAKKIERLAICIDEKDEGTGKTIELLFLLQNLRSLSYYMDQDHPVYENVFGGATRYPWLKHIEHISEYSRDSLATRLLSSSICPNLTTLVIDDYRRINGLGCLQNAPALKHLTISFATIGFRELESIHESLPRLCSIKFSSITLQSFEFNEDIRPATHVTECIFEYSKSTLFRSLIQLLVYISRKYPNLSKLSYDLFAGQAEEEAIQIMSDYGWSPLFQRLGRQLKKLCINENRCANNDIFEKMDMFSCQIDHLSLSGLLYSSFLKLTRSQQVFYIQTLALNDIEFETFEWLKELGQLSKLTLRSCFSDEVSRVINLNGILENSPPTLRSLYLEYSSLFFDLECTVLSPIQTLSFHWMVLPVKTDTFISRHFPQLSTLKLSKCNQLGKTLDFETMDFSSIYFTDDYHRNEYCIAVSTSGNNELRRYYIDGRIHNIMPENLLETFHSLNHVPFKSSPENESRTVPDFTLFCNSVRNFILTK